MSKVRSSQKVTIVDIAREAQVSTSTVSLVLRKSGRISAETVSRVHEVIDRLGYTYNRNAANLRQQKSQVIGLVINDIRNPFFAELTSGVQQALEGTNVMFFLVDTKDNMDEQDRVCRSLREFGIGGLIIFPVASTRKRFFRELSQDLSRDGAPLCVILRNPGEYQTNFVGPDNHEAGRIATQHLINLGHRRIAYIGGEAEGQARIERVESYQQTLLAAGLDIDPSLNLAGRPDRDITAALMRQVMTLPHPPTAAVCHNDNVAITAMHSLRAMGKVPGKDLCMVGIDGIPQGAETQPGLTTVQMHGSEIGRRAVQLILSRMENLSLPIETVTLRPELIVRGSCGSKTAG